MKRPAAAVAALLALSLTLPATAQLLGNPPRKQVEDIWKPAATPKGGTSWKLLESTKEQQRVVNDVIYSKPVRCGPALDAPRRVARIAKLGIRVTQKELA